MLPIEALQERVSNSELGREWTNDPLLNQDIWSFEELGYTEEEISISEKRNIHFKDFSLSWLKLLAKLTTLAAAREKHKAESIYHKLTTLRQLDRFLVSRGYLHPELITDALLREFTSLGNTNNRRGTIVYATRLWVEEQWLNLAYTPPRYKRKKPKVEIIPEEVLFQIYEHFDLFPAPLERLFRLQFALGCRIGEMITMPRQCLKQENSQWFLLRWVLKRKHWKFSQIDPLVAELVRAQQKFLEAQFGSKPDFNKLFCKISTANRDGAKGYGKRFEVEPVYFPKLLTRNIILSWLRAFSKKVDLRDKHGKRFKLTSHMFRRTKASIMAYCEAEDEYIAAVLGHGSLDMLIHYREHPLENIEKEAKTKGYVDKHGHVTTFKPRKRRYERLAEMLDPKITIPGGECHRPTMMGDCELRYSCLGCGYHRVTEEDRPYIEADIRNLEKDLEQALNSGRERKVTEINHLLKLLINRLQGLDELENLKGEKINE